MFSAKNHNDRKAAAQAQLMQLDQKERVVLETVEKVIQASETERLDLIQQIKNYPPSRVFQFTTNSTVFNGFCRDEHYSHISYWADILKQQDFFGFTITSVDGKQQFSIVDQYLSAYLFTKHAKLVSSTQSQAALDTACDYGLFYGLTERCHLTAQNIKAAKNDQSYAIHSLMEDFKVLGNLYWSIGYFHAAQQLFDLGNHFAQQDSLREIRRSIIFYNAAASNFFCGKELMAHERLEDKNIINMICRSTDDNISLTLAKNFRFSSWKSASEFFLSKIDNAINPHIKIQCDAKNHIALLLNSRKRPTL